MDYIFLDEHMYKTCTFYTSNPYSLIQGNPVISTMYKKTHTQAKESLAEPYCRKGSFA